MSDVSMYHEGLDRYIQVPESAVGHHAMSGWVQQDPPPEGPVEKPAKNASRDAWAEYALGQGVAAEDVDGMGRDELVAFFDDAKAEEATEGDEQ